MHGWHQTTKNLCSKGQLRSFWGRGWCGSPWPQTADSGENLKCTKCILGGGGAERKFKLSRKIKGNSIDGCDYV